MKIATAKLLGTMPVYDLRVDHESHSFVHASGVVLHNCAFVIADRPVAEFLPLQKISDVRVTQYDMGDVEAAGGLKMDFLVVNSLKDIQEAVKLVQERSPTAVDGDRVVNGKRVPPIRQLPHQGEVFDIWDLPEDQAVFHDIAEGRTETVFQFNTSGARQWLPHFDHWKDKWGGRKSIDSIEALAAFTALDRPGPLDAKIKGPEGREHNMLVEYARRARGEEPYGEIPLLTKILPETYGIIIYQEALQKVYQTLMECSGSEAEEFRSNIAKKKMEKVLKAFGPWMSKVGQLYGDEVAKAIWNQAITFGAYGFNLSHAVSYVVISYACAFLKHHYPLEWWTAVLRNADKGEIVETFWRHCGHLINYPDVRTATSAFSITPDGRIQAPTSLLNGVGEKAQQQLVTNAPYASIDDFCEKIEHHCRDHSTPVLDETGRQVIETKTVRKRGKEPTTVETLKVKRGHNHLNKKVCYTLVLVGAMDGLFPQGIADLDKLSMFEAAMAKAQGKKPKPVDDKYLNLTAVQRYQMRKTILPAYSQEILPLLTMSGDRRIVKKQRREGGGEMFFWPGNGGWIPFLRPEGLRRLEEMNPLPPGKGVWAALAAYVVAQRHFTYHGHKEACELQLDVDGVAMKYVKWPDQEGNLADLYKQPLKGAVVIASVSRRKDDRPFGLEYVTIIHQPLSDRQGSEEDDQGPGR